MEMTIYLSDLAAYNGGLLVGEHVSLPMSDDDLRLKIAEILKRGADLCQENKHEEYFITDYECDFMEIHEFSDPFELNRIAQEAETLNDHELKIVRFLLSNGLVKDYSEAVEHIEDVIIHEGPISMEDIAYDYINECYDIESLAPIIVNSIDYRKIGAELAIDGQYFEIDGDIYEYLG